MAKTDRGVDFITIDGGDGGTLEEVLKHYLQAHDFSMEQIIETALLD